MSDRFTADKLAWLEQVTADTGLSHVGARLCTLLALRFLNRETGTAWPSQTVLMDMLGVSEATLKRVVKEIRGAGHLDVVVSSGRGRANEYRPVLRPVKGSTSEPLSDDKRVHQRTPSFPEKGSSVTDKRVHQRTPNPMKEPIERIAALSLDEESEADLIFAMMPKGSASRSNRSKIREAVAQIVSEGTPAISLKIAVGAFVAASPDAKDQDGRFMGAAHTWLTEKRGWEAYLPSADDLFLRSRPEGDAQWFHRVRSWQHSPGYWRMKRDDFGPEPDAPGTRVPQAVLAYCLENAAPAPRPANDTHRRGEKRVGWV